MIIKKKKKWKLVKKWRFWRQFKRFFLNYKKKIIFSRLKWFFNQKRILWHRLSDLYGKKIQKLVFRNKQAKTAFNSRFINLLFCLETRLNIFLIRIGFAKKLLEANNLIQNKYILINGFLKKSNYSVCIGDIIRYFFFS